MEGGIHMRSPDFRTLAQVMEQRCYRENLGEADFLCVEKHLERAFGIFMRARAGDKSAVQIVAEAREHAKRMAELDRENRGTGHNCVHPPESVVMHTSPASKKYDPDRDNRQLSPADLELGKRGYELRQDGQGWETIGGILGLKPRAAAFRAKRAAQHYGMEWPPPLRAEELAYLGRLKGRPWAVVAENLSLTVSTAEASAKRWAKRYGRPWPVPAAPDPEKDVANEDAYIRLRSRETSMAEIAAEFGRSEKATRTRIKEWCERHNRAWPIMRNSKRVA